MNTKLIKKSISLRNFVIFMFATLANINSFSQSKFDSDKFSIEEQYTDLYFLEANIISSINEWSAQGKISKDSFLIQNLVDKVLKSSVLGLDKDFSLVVWKELTPYLNIFPGKLIVVSTGYLQRNKSYEELIFAISSELVTYNNKYLVNKCNSNKDYRKQLEKANYYAIFELLGSRSKEEYLKSDSIALNTLKDKNFNMNNAFSSLKSLNDRNSLELNKTDIKGFFTDTIKHEIKSFEKISLAKREKNEKIPFKFLEEEISFQNNNFSSERTENVRGILKNLNIVKVKKAAEDNSYTKIRYLACRESAKSINVFTNLYFGLYHSLQAYTYDSLDYEMLSLFTSYLRQLALNSQNTIKQNITSETIYSYPKEFQDTYLHLLSLSLSTYYVKAYDILFQATRKFDNKEIWLDYLLVAREILDDNKIKKIEDEINKKFPTNLNNNNNQ